MPRSPDSPPSRDSGTRTSSAFSRRTGSTSTSTNRPPTAEEMQQAVYLLTTRRPHEDDELRMTDVERSWYERGYYRALIAALRAMEHVLVRRALWLKQRRRNA